MKFSDYLKTRPNGQMCNAITNAEARLCGIPLPLSRGWPKRFADLEVDEDAMRAAASELRKVKAERRAQQYALAGISRKERRAQRAQRKKEKRLARAAKPRKTFWATDKFLESYEWRVLRMKALKRDGAECACCGATRDDGLKMHVDHIKPRKTHPELALSLDNLQVLCEVCNHGKGNWDSTDWRRKPAANDALDEQAAAHIASIKAEA